MDRLPVLGSDDRQELVEEINKIRPVVIEPQLWDVQTRVHQHLNEFGFETRQDVQPYLDAAKELRESHQRHSKDRPFVQKYIIPIVALKKALTELGIPHFRMYRLSREERQRLNVLLKSPDYKRLRTLRGRY